VAFRVSVFLKEPEKTLLKPCDHSFEETHGGNIQHHHFDRTEARTWMTSGPEFSASNDINPSSLKSSACTVAPDAYATLGITHGR
jgi:hypothetical protein